MTSSSPSTSSTNYVLVLGHVTLLALWLASQYVYIPFPAHLLTLVTAILYVACHQSLLLAPAVHERLQTEAKKAAAGGDADMMEPLPRETLRKEDAYQFPIVGSFALFGLYLAFKYLDPAWVNFLIGGYFGIAGLIAMTITFTPYMEQVLLLQFRNHPKLHQLQLGWGEWWVPHPLPEWVAGPSPWDWSLHLSLAQVLAIGLAKMTLLLYFTSHKAWFLNNVIGMSFCLQGVRNFSVGSYQIAAILLIGLFFYDIFWVFGTEVMVKVATNLDGPIKLLLPRESLEPDPETGKLNLSLLGLGDIVIPGFFLALMLRFDFHLHVEEASNLDWSSLLMGAGGVEHASFPKPYFMSTLLGYVLGLGTTLFVMFHFNAAQPALLYLVPACVGASFLCAVMRGEVKALLEYTEEEEMEEEIMAEEPPQDDKPNGVDAAAAKKDN